MRQIRFFVFFSFVIVELTNSIDRIFKYKCLDTNKLKLPDMSLQRFVQGQRTKKEKHNGQSCKVSSFAYFSATRAIY